MAGAAGGLTPESIRAAWDGASEAQRNRWRAWAARRRRDKAEHPLAYAELWHREAPRTSQRTAMQRLVAPGISLAFLLGGNRSSKSYTGAAGDVCWGLGRDHPDVVRFARLNGLDLSEIPEGPGTVVVGAPDSNDSRRYVRPAVAQFLPAGTKWRNREGSGEAEARYTDDRGTATWIFKSVDQGRDGWQGFSARVVRFDEEPKDSAVVSEAMMRVADQSGRLIFTMTPLFGWTALLERYIRDPAPDVGVYHLHGTDNPHVPADALRAIYAKFGPHERAARERGEIVALEGRVYEDWRRDLHLIPAFAIPDDWPRYVGVDFGTRNPTAVLWAALDERDDTLHVYRGRWWTQTPQERIARLVRGIMDDEPEPEWTVADAAGTAERMTWVQHDVPTLPSPKGVRAGISSVAERLHPDAEGRPHLVVHDTPDLAPLVREIESYVWDTTRSKGDLPDRPLKKNDHGLDALQYLCRRLQMERGPSEYEVEDRRAAK